MTSGVPKTKAATERRLQGQRNSGATRRQDPAASPPTQYLAALERIRSAEARIKEARARRDEIANEKVAGELIDASAAAVWSRTLLAAVRIEADGLAAHVDLMGLSPEIAAPLRKAAADLARRFRNRVASIPELVSPPAVGQSA